MPISLPDMIIPKYRITQLPILPILPPLPKSKNYSNVTSRYMLPSSKVSIHTHPDRLNKSWKTIHGS